MTSFRILTFAGAVALPVLLSGGVSVAQMPPPDQTRIIHVSAAAGQSTQRVALGVNQAVIVELDRDVRDAIVANPLIADVVVRSPRRVFIMTIKQGQTSALLVDAAGRQIANLQISVNFELSGLNAEFARQMPGSRIKAAAMGSNVVLSGTAKNVEEASLARELAEHFAGSADAVVNNMTINERQQVLIQVRVSEMSRAISKQFGINGAAIAKTAGVPIAVETDNQFSLTGRALSNTFAAAGNTGCLVGSELTCKPAPNNVTGVLQALERIGLVHTLAEPNLTAVSGEAARFLAGGEFPVPASRDRDGNVTVDYKQFGVGLGFTPVVLSEGRISLKISTEVSELTNTGSFTANGGTTSTGQSAQGLTLPALSVRRTETTVELPSGGTLAIGGLIQQQTKQNLDALPGVKDLPVLGALFRSRDFQNNETELVVTVTAYIVKPTAPTQIAGPDDGFAPPGDLETILLGRLNAIYSKEGKIPAGLDKNSLGYVIQ